MENGITMVFADRTRGGSSRADKMTSPEPRRRTSQGYVTQVRDSLNNLPMAVRLAESGVAADVKLGLLE